MRSIAKFAKLAVKVEEELLLHQTNSNPYKPDCSSDEELARDIHRECCRYCKLYVGERELLEAHVRERHPEYVTCPECSEVQQNVLQLKRHLRLHKSGYIEKRARQPKREKVIKANGKVVRKYRCKECDLLVTDIRRHQVVAHTKEYNFPCEECEKKFPTPNDLKVHVRKIHRGEFSSLCAECGKGFSCKTALEDHERKHRGERPFVCEVCGRDFFSKSHLVNHAQIHDASKELECDICPKRFPTANHLRQHRKGHFEENRTFHCNMCERRFFKQCTLTYHIKKHHTMERPFECDLCQKGFVTRYQMKEHTQRHLGLKPHACKFCSNTYAKKANLKRHWLSNHRSQVPVFMCDQCPKVYLSERSVHDHKQRWHNPSGGEMSADESREEQTADEGGEVQTADEGGGMQTAKEGEEVQCAVQGLLGEEEKEKVVIEFQEEEVKHFGFLKWH